MKSVISILLLFLVSSFSSTLNLKNSLNRNGNSDPDIFVSDSGYILHKQAINLLRKVEDTAIFMYDDYKDTDTLGKYYKTKTGNYLSCIIDVRSGYDSHLIVESKPDGTILDNQRFEGGNYSCCWNNNYEGFKKLGDYYSVKTCTTGAGLCSEETYFFKSLISQHKQSFIITNSWFSMYSDEKRATDLSSEIEIKSDTIIAHYTLKKIKMGNKRNKVKKTEKFDVRYIQRESKWVALDSSKISDLPR